MTTNEPLKFDLPATALEILPIEYRKNESGIFKIKTREDRDGNVTEEILIPLCYTPLRVSKILENPDTHEVFYIISFPTKNGSGEKDVTVSGGELFQKKGIMALAGQGVIVAEGMVKGLTNYLAQIVSLNNIPTLQIYDKFGWKEDGGFVLGKTKFTSEKQIPITLSVSSKQTEAIKESGTVDGWLHAVEGLMKYDNQRFKMYVAVTATILKIVEESNFSLNDFGETSIGKTLSTKLAMSIYGNPDDLLLSGDSTKVGIERMAAQFCDIPVNLDDTQNIHKEVLASMIYMIANGVGKLRGAKLGGLQEVLSWRTVGMFTGEAPIVTDSSFMGMDMRVLEISGGIGKIDTEAVKIFQEEIHKNHGVFAPLLIEYLMKNMEDVKAIHEETSCLIINDVKGKYAMDTAISGMAGRTAGMFASILTAGYIFEDLYEKIGGKRKNPEPIVTARFEKALKRREFGSYAEKGLNHILSWISANKSSFLMNGVRESDTAGNPKIYKIFGNITPEYYDILPSELKTELKRSEFDYNGLMEAFKDAGYLECNIDRNQKSVRIEGELRKVYRFKRKNIEQSTGVDDEEGN